MATMTKKERVQAALSGQPVDSPPVSLWRHDFLREWAPRDLAAVTLEGYRACDWDFIKLNPRSTYFAEAWGNQYERPTGSYQPRLLQFAVRAPEELARLQAVDPQGGVFGEQLTALRLVLKEVGREVDVVHTVFSPLAVVAQLCGSNEALREYAGKNPTALRGALSAVAVTLAGYAEAAVGSGAAGIFFAPLRWASRETCEEEFYAQWGRPYDLQVLAAVEGAAFNILHVCSNHNMIDLVLDYPVAALNWADRGEGNLSLAAVRQRTPKAVMGGIDHTRLQEMTEREIGEQVRAAMAAGPERLFVSGGCTIAPETPTSKQLATVKAVRGR